LNSHTLRSSATLTCTVPLSLYSITFDLDSEILSTSPHVLPARDSTDSTATPVFEQVPLRQSWFQRADARLSIPNFGRVRVLRTLPKFGITGEGSKTGLRSPAACCSMSTNETYRLVFTPKFQLLTYLPFSICLPLCFRRQSSSVLVDPTCVSAASSLRNERVRHRLDRTALLRTSEWLTTAPNDSTTRTRDHRGPSVGLYRVSDGF